MIVVANWKMNPVSQFQAEKLAKISDKKNIILCPPFVFLSRLSEIIKNAELGAQNIFWKEKGSFTGEISVDMIKKMNCRYVLIGHSERREIFFENDQIINKKILSALNKKIKVIFCIGEKEKDLNKWKEILRNQIKKGLIGVSQNNFSKIIIAYEPVWAIGTGKSCDFKKAEIVRIFISNFFNNNFSNNKIKILYGGSVNSINYSDYIEKAGFDGLLVGGASLKSKEFLKIIKRNNLS